MGSRGFACALKLRTAARPAAVAVRTIGARRMGLRSEGEGFVVDAVGVTPASRAARSDRVGEAVGAADVDVAVGERPGASAASGPASRRTRSRGPTSSCRRPPRRRDALGDLVAQDEVLAA